MSLKGRTMLVEVEKLKGTRRFFLSTLPGKREYGPFVNANQMLDYAKSHNVIPRRGNLNVRAGQKP